MKEILVCEDKYGTAVLTTDSPASHYGIPVLRVDSEDVSGDFGPADILGELPNLFTAADVVASWASQEGRTEEEISAARMFLAQWPEGPQIK